MKKTNLLTKTLLVAAMLGTGASNAWSDDVYTILYGNPTYDTDGVTVIGVTPQTDFTSDDGATASDITSSDLNGANCTNAMPIGGSVLYAGSCNPAYTHNFSTAPTKGIVHFEANYTSTTANTQTWQILDSNGVEIWGSSSAGQASSNATKDIGFCNNVSIGTNWYRNPRGCHHRVVLDINFSTRKVSYTILASSGNNSYSTLTGNYDLPAGVTDVKGLKGNRQSSGAYTTYMDNVSFYNVYDDAITLYDYTINYKDGDDIVKTFSSSAAADEVVTAESVVDGTEAGFVGNHYLIVAAEAPTMTITSGTNVLNVPVRAPYTATVTVTKNIGGVAQTPEVFNFTETDAKVCSWVYTYDKYVYHNSKYYVADVTSSYGESGTFEDGDDIVKTVYYTSEDASIMGYTEMGTGGTNTALSGGATGSNNSELASCTLDAGGYVAEIYVQSKAGSGSHTRGQGVYVNGVSVIGTPTDTYGLISLPFTVTADNTPVYVKGTNSGSSYNTDNLDYVVIKKVENISVEVTAAGYATYVNSDYNLDFSASQIEAYKVEVSTKGVATMTKVNEVPAGTPVLLYKEGGATEDIPVIASAAAVTGNDLVAGTGAAVETIDGEYTNMILNNGTSGIGFYKANGQTVAANRAYLHIATSLAPGAGSRMVMEFANDETTGISEELIVNSEESATAPVYNLNGQRVEKATKGLFIVSGKKVMK